MRVSLSTIKQYTGVDLPIDELVALINSRLGGVEEVTNLGEKYKDVVIVKVVECEKHPDADRLSVTKIDDGGVVEDVPRDENGLVQVVCGAPNVHADMFAVWLPPKSTVPASFDDDEPFVLDARPLRGVLSQGMLAAADELAIGTDHAGIIQIDPNEWKPTTAEIKPGASFAEAYGLDDYVIDIENKMFTHRPDLFGQLGVAREIAGIQHKQFISPSWYSSKPIFEDGSGLELEVTNEALENVPRFMAVALKNIEIKPSPLWLRIELVRLGSKPINNIVDVTNYVMLLTAQPTHAYDYDKLRGHKLISRMAKQGESIKLLNGKTYQLDEADIVIADGEGPVGLAGIMGGSDSEVDENTKNIVLEVATFDMYAVRKSAMRHGVFTDALTRFNKGQSPVQNDVVLKLLITSIFDVSDGTQASSVFDEHAPDFDKNFYEPISLDEQFIDARLGLTLSRDEIKELLENVELKVFTETDMTITKPFWRTDLELPEDIVEEVGRLYGFDKLPRELPSRSMKPAATNPTLALADTIRDILSRAGANEVLTYSFVHEDVIKKAGQDPEEAYRIGNALSPDLQYYRLSLTPSLLDKIHGNIKAGHDEFALFELGKSHTKKAPLSEDEGLPPEMRRIALSYAAKKSGSESTYYKAKALLDFLATKLGLVLQYKPLGDAGALTIARPFAPNRSARVIDRESQQVIGVIGEYNVGVKRAFKLPQASAGFEIMPEAIEIALKNKENGYKSLSRYPSTSRDISLEVSQVKMYAEVLSVLEDVINTEALDGVAISISPISIYQAEGADDKTFTFRVSFTPSDKTLVGDEVSRMMDAAGDKAVSELDAKIV